MSQDATKVVLAGSLSNVRDIESLPVAPSTFLAGLVASLGTDGLPTLSLTTMLFGVSRGRSLSDTDHTAFQRAGLGVPVRAALKRSTGTVTITDIANLVDGTDDTITIGGTAFTATDGAVTPGQATFDARTGTTEAAASLAAQINAHATANTKVYAVASGAVVTLYAKVEGAGTGHDVTTTYEQLGNGVGATVQQAALAGGSNTISSIAYAVKGAKMYVNKTTGKADINMGSFTQITDARYTALGPKTGIAEDASEVGAVVVDMPGGL